MALTFPSGTTIGEKYTEGDKSWQWNGTTWDKVTIGSTVHSETAPSSPVDGQIWINKTNGKAYYAEGNNWIQLTTSAHTPAA